VRSRFHNEVQNDAKITSGKEFEIETFSSMSVTGTFQKLHEHRETCGFPCKIRTLPKWESIENIFNIHLAITRWRRRFSM